MKKKIAAVALAALMTLGTAACAKGGKDPVTQQKTPIETVTEEEVHPVSSGLHDVRVTPRDNILIKDGQTDYTVVIPEEASDLAARAGSLIVSHLTAATGAAIGTETDGALSYAAEKKYIVVGSEKLFTQSGHTMPERDIGETGFYIVTEGNSVFIAANGGYGLRNGAIRLLNILVGYEMYADDTVAYTAGSTVTLPAMEITEKPDFEFGFPSNANSQDATMGMGFMSTPDVFIPVEGLNWHNTFAYLPKATYLASHPAWYATDGSQLCYTARGDEAEFNAMLDAVADKLIRTVDANTRANNITFTIEDTATFCTCDACNASYQKYGTDAAVVIKFCNLLSERLDAHLKALSEQNGTPLRTVNLLFFAYNKTTQPPVRKQGDTYVPIDDSVVCRDNVGVYIAPITAVYNRSFYDKSNQTTAEVIKGWGVLSKKLYMWLYETNYSHYLYPLNSYSTMLETFRFCKENNAIFMFPEGQWNQGNVTCFGKFKEYFDSKAEWDVNLDYNKLVDDFFANYFLDAAEPMRKYFDELQAQLYYLEEAFPAEVNGNIYNNMAQARFWPKRLLDRWAGYIDEAYAACERYKSDNERYETLRRHILIESLFIRFAQVTLHAGSYSVDELNAMRASFREDCALLTVTMRSEVESLDGTFAGWDE